jgi:putative colanic acid biosynthesis acetyltransferase WcaF
MVTLEDDVTVSQYSYLCTAGHRTDILNKNNGGLIVSPIFIEKKAWVAARAYIGPGVTIGEGAVVGATASVYKDVEPWTVVGGNPAKFLKKRVIRKQESKGNCV